jgi:H+-transporting ATPase
MSSLEFDLKLGQPLPGQAPDRAPVAQVTPAAGLSSEEAEQRLAQYGPNAVAREKSRPALAFLRKFWAPVPWMLEATVVLELVLGRYVEGVVIGVLLVFNALLSFLQENRAQSALSLLRQQLTVQARVLRDGRWQQVAAENLVPGDVIHLRMGDLVPADLHLTEGQVQVDQSALTGESAPVETGPGSAAHAGAMVRRGEATGEVVATGARTAFGQTAELVRTARTVSHLEQIVFTVVKYLVLGDVGLVVMVMLYALLAGIAWQQLLPFALILLVASVPVALPATFTLATALGASELARQGVLATRLSAIEEAAAMDVLASDKTGTITANRLALAGVKTYMPFSEDEVLRLAALASDEATQDPLDMAILDAARERHLQARDAILHFTPFDPATRRSEALVRQANGDVLHVVKGAVATIAGLCAAGPRPNIEQDAADLAAQGDRILAIASGPQDGPLQLAGLLGLQDPPREDSRALVGSLKALGVRVIMVTGDDPLTAQSIAEKVDIHGATCTAESLRDQVSPETLGCSVFAGVFPADKYHLVQALQSSGHVVGMTGDGVNDAPALKQAEVGIAVTNATDVAKAAASLVLTTPGLSNIVAAVQSSRRIYQRMLTYTLNKIIKTFQVALFLSLGLVLGGVFVVTPLLVVLLLFANDFVTMALATDNVSFASQPDRWRVRTLAQTALALAIPALFLALGLFYVAQNVWHLPLPQLQTLMFVMLVFSGQGTVYLVRERDHFWHSLPSRWMLVASLADIIIVSVLATQGLLMAAVPVNLVAIVLVTVLVYMILIDFFKIWVFKRFQVR